MRDFVCLLFLLVVPFFSGCTRVGTHPQHAYDEVRAVVSERSGYPTPPWHRYDPDPAVEETICQLLQQNLTEDLAV